ncbi:unnamed protein product [Blepharisma stoltei]|uniref:Ribosomal protein S4 n=1 Tax=Blepharisma stoltei TaxID=1481888 RepID=A0AAU9IQX0_9CILI|nr:unnamed protein product [Blepharisma stoltei]
MNNIQFPLKMRPGSGWNREKIMMDLNTNKIQLLRKGVKKCNLQRNRENYSNNLLQLSGIEPDQKGYEEPFEDSVIFEVYKSLTSRSNVSNHKNKVKTLLKMGLATDRRIPFLKPTTQTEKKGLRLAARTLDKRELDRMLISPIMFRQKYTIRPVGFKYLNRIRTQKTIKTSR